MGCQSDMLHLDIFPRRLNRNNVTSAQRVLSLVPSAMLQYWENAAVNAIEPSKASVILNMGAYAARIYAKSLVARRVRYRVNPNTSQIKKSTVLDWFEFTIVDDFEVLSRVVLKVPHLELFHRHRGYEINEVRRAIATQEHLIDYITVLLYSHTNMPTSLSTRSYYQDRRLGIIVPLEVFMLAKSVADYDSIDLCFNRPFSVIALRHCSIDTQPSRRRVFV
jgi:hypothetical protein